MEGVSMPEVYIRSTDTTQPLGRLVQDYAERYYTTGFIEGACLGVCVGIGIGVTMAMAVMKRL